MGGLERERDQKLVRAMITMSHELNYRVVAEGVETQEAYEFLAKSGCDEIPPALALGVRQMAVGQAAVRRRRARRLASRTARQDSHSWGGCAMARP